jgi:hypothetical protein
VTRLGRQEVSLGASHRVGLAVRGSEGSRGSGIDPREPPQSRQESIVYRHAYGAALGASL